MPATSPTADPTIMTDTVVIGLGLIGSGALAALAEGGEDCVGIGPAEPPVLSEHHGVFASHYDSGRITRHLDPRREWATLAARSIAGYAAREQASGIAFHRPVGVILAEIDRTRIDAISSVAAELHVDTHRVEPAAAATHDERLRFPAGSTLLTEGTPAGHIDPRRMLAANLVTAERRGAHILRHEVTALTRSGDRWIATAADGTTVDAARVVVAAGPHTDELLTRAGLVPPAFAVRGETVITATIDEQEQARLRGLPSVLARLAEGPYEDLYLVGATDYPDGSVRLKLGATLRHLRRLDTADARRRWMAGDEHRHEHDDLQGLLEGLIVGLRATATETRPCLITDTPNGVPIVTHLAPGLVVAAGGNGYAAKSANAIGALAAHLAVEGRWTDAELEEHEFGIDA